MRKLLILALLFLAACSAQPDVQQHDIARLFNAMATPVDTTATVFSGEDATAIADLAADECPDVPDEFARVVLDGKGGRLVLYTNPDGSDLYCGIVRPDEVSTSASEGPEGMVLSVNGVDIPQSLLAARIATGERGEVATNTIINDELLRQEAEIIEVTPEEVALAMAELGNVSVEVATDQAQLERLLRDRLLVEDIEVTEENAREYYLANTNLFVQTEQAVMRHIMVSGERPDVEGRVNEIAQRLNSTDFCVLVEQYSDDRTEDCGVFVIPRGVVHPNLESAAFNTPVGQTAVVATDAGVHFVQSLEVVPARVVPYSDVASGLQSTILNSIFQQRLSLYLQLLRADADIVIYN